VHALRQVAFASPVVTLRLGATRARPQTAKLAKVVVPAVSSAAKTAE